MDQVINQGDAVVNLVSKLGTITQAVALKWYKASQFATTFKSTSDDVQSKYERWTVLLRRCNVQDPYIESMLTKAMTHLDEEAKNVENLKSACWFRRKCTTLTFPEDLTHALEDILKTFTRISDHLAERGAIAQHVEMEAFNRPYLLPFFPDKKYVKFKKTLVAVREALESEIMGRVVTLYGGPGQGKTSMAKHLALFYQETTPRVQPVANVVQEEALSGAVRHGSSHRLPKTGIFNCCGLLDCFWDVPTDLNPSTNDQTEVKSKRFPDGVFYYPCGTIKNSKEILFQLWRDLGYQLFSPPTSAGKGQASHNDPMQEYFASSQYLLKELLEELSKRLGNQKILIVFYDIQDPKLLADLLVSAKWVKYLITTQEEDLLHKASFSDRKANFSDGKAIGIERPTPEEAYEVLQAHMEGFPKDPSQELKAAIYEFIRKLSIGNPMVLANMAAFISGPDIASTVEKWESTGKELAQILGRNEAEPTSDPFDLTISKEIMRASVENAVKFFKKPEEDLLLLACLCEDQSIPEVVLLTFFKGIHLDKLKLFSNFREKLKKHNFLKIENMTATGSTSPQTTYVEQSTQREEKLEKSNFVRIEKTTASGSRAPQTSLVIQSLQVEKKSKKRSFLKNENVIAPRSTAPRKSWVIQSIQRQIICSIKAEKRTSLGKQLLACDIKDHKIAVVLLALYGQEDWRKQAIEKLKGDDSKDLQKYESLHFSAIQPFVWLLQEDWAKKSNKSNSCVEEILHHYLVEGVLHDSSLSMLLATPGAAVATIEALEKMAILKDGPILTIDHPETAHALLNKLRVPVKFNESWKTTAHRSAWLLARFSFDGFADASPSFPKLVEDLSELLGESRYPNVQECASLALAHLSKKEVAYPIDIEQFQIKILAALLAHDINNDVQRNVAAVLGNICVVEANAIAIASSPEAKKRLMELLAHKNADVQQQAAFALGNLCSGPETNITKIASLITRDDIKNAIQGLVALLEENLFPDVQETAAWALGSLSVVPQTATTIASARPGAIDGLVALLASHARPDVQYSAAWALGKFATHEEGNIITTEMARHDLIDALVELLADGVNPRVQRAAAWTFGRISYGAVKQVDKLPSFPDGIAKLVELLATVNPDVQKGAASALGDIAYGEVEHARMIVYSNPGAIENLVTLLAKESSSDVQRVAALALLNICAKDVKSAYKIATKPQALKRLFKLLDKEVDPDVQRNAALVLNSIRSDPKNRDTMKMELKTDFPNADVRVNQVLRLDETPFFFHVLFVLIVLFSRFLL